MLCSVVLPITAFATEEPAIAVSQGEGKLGDEVSLDLSLAANPGIISATIRIDYNPEALELINVEDAGVLGATSHKPELTPPYTLAWVNDTATTNFTVSGTIATLTFLVCETADEGEAYDVSVSYDYENYDIYDKDVEPVLFECVDGSITVLFSEEPQTEEIVTTAPVTEPTQPITAEPTEPATAAPTQPATAAPTQPATAAPTQPATAKPTQPATAAPTQPATAKPTEPATAAPTKPVETQAPTEPAETEAPTVTEPLTQPNETSAPTQPEPTEKPTEATQAPTQAPTEAPTAATQAPTEAPTVAPATKAPTQKTETKSTTKTTKTSKKENPIKVSIKNKTIKLKKLKKKSQKIKAITVKNAKGKVSYKLVDVPDRIKKLVKINSKGEITFKSWANAKKGTYAVEVSVSAKGTSKYRAAKVTKTVKIKVK